MTFRTFTRSALAVVLIASAASVAPAGMVTFNDNMTERYIDVFLTPSPNSEFTNFDILVTPTAGGLLDPVRNQAGNAGDFDNVTDAGARVDTWANTAFSSLGAGTPSYVFTEYHPGAPPFTPSQQLPTFGATLPNPDQLNWSVFDTNTGDTAANGPYHVARVMYTAGGTGTVQILAFDTVTAATGGETFNGIYGIPEPATMALAGMGLIGFVALRRRSAC